MHPDTLGWAAAALMVATFSCREARHLRPLAVATNLAFIGYGAAAGLMPVLALHLLLLPINLWRWMQVARLSRSLVRQGLDRGARLLATVALASLPLMTGCGGGGDEQAPASSAPPPALPPAAPPAAPSVATIGPAGGSVTLSDGTLVTLPAGAQAGEVTLEVMSEPATAPAVPAALKALGKTYAWC